MYGSYWDCHKAFNTCSPFIDTVVFSVINSLLYIQPKNWYPSLVGRGHSQNELGVFNQGLNKSQIDKYKHLFGKNEIIEEKHESTLIIFVNQFKDLLVIILIAAGIISAISGEFESTIVILIVITLNALLVHLMFVVMVFFFA